MRNIILIFSVFFLFQACSYKEKKELVEEKIQYQDLFDSTANDKVSCYRIPAIVTAVNGNLLVAIDERVPSCADLRGNNNINIVLRRSTDNGENWSEIETVVDFELGKSASDPSFIVNEHTKEIFLFYNYMDLTKEKDVYYLQYVKSKDNGKTWSKPIDITNQIAKPAWKNDFKFITSGRGIYTSTGKMLHCLVNLQKGLYVFGSDNHGESWYFIDTPIKPADESKIVELNNGSWMINSRVNGSGARYVHISLDEGKTWKTRRDSNLIDPSCNASIIRYTSVEEGYKKDRLLFANAKMTKERKNLTVRVSYDEGKTWTKGKTIYNGSAAYSSLTKLQNGKIAIFFEKDGYTKNAFARFSLEWLTNNQDKYEEPN